MAEEKKPKPQVVYAPHSFDYTKEPHIRLTAYEGGIASDEKNLPPLKKIMEDLSTAMTKGGFVGLADSINTTYYGSAPGDIVIIPITDAFKKSQETTFESFDPASYFQGSFGGAGMMVGANIFQFNGILGKFWSGSSIGIGALTFSVAVDLNNVGANLVPDALQKNFDYIKGLEKLCFPNRPNATPGVFRPPRFFSMWGGVGAGENEQQQFFRRKYVGIKRCDIETLGMWQSGASGSAGGKILPTAYNVTIEVDDMIVGRES